PAGPHGAYIEHLWSLTLWVSTIVWAAIIVAIIVAAACLMCSACRNAAIVALAACASFACEREQRNFADSPTTSAQHEYEANAYALSEGKRLYGWYNCNGCHAE